MGPVRCESKTGKRNRAFGKNALPVLALALALASSARANVAGGGTGTGANVTVTQSGGNVTLANGIVSFTVDTANGNVTAFSYNGVDYLAGGDGGAGGYFYIDGSGGPTFTAPTYTLTVNPTANGGDQAEVELEMDGSPLDVRLYYDLLRGQAGIYDTLILTHQTGYADYPGAELRTNLYVGGQFDWICVDPYRFRQMAGTTDTHVATAGAPPEVFDFTSGIYSGTTGCKYSYSEPLGPTNAYGWASSTSDYGVWQTFPSHEYLDGGPLHRELTAHLGNTLLDMFGGGHYGFGLTQDLPAGTFASKTFGPAFIYADRYAGSATAVSIYAQSLYADAQAQAAAEQSAWPYSWFNPAPVSTGSGTTSPAYVQASGRGGVSGTFAIADADNAAASPAGMWIGLAPDEGGVDFQQQYFTYQFWTRTAGTGAFTIPNVLPGTYDLWAFGPGAAGTFSRSSVVVSAGSTTALGTVTWTPPRLGPTVWQIGVPDRSSEEFNNGEHDVSPWSGVLPPYAGGAPYNIPTDWSAFLDYANQYPTGVSFTVGVSDPAVAWNYCQPTVLNASGDYVGTSSSIYFQLAAAPATGAEARLTIGFAAVYAAACILTVNGQVQTGAVVESTDGVNAASVTNPTTGFYPANYSFDTMVRLGSNGAWGDAYLDFPASELKAGWNEIDIGMRPTGTAGNGNGFEYDFVRLECQGYSASPTPSPSASASGTSSPTLTWTKTASPSPSGTATPTGSATRTASPSVSPTPTPTMSVSGTPSGTESPSPSLSASGTLSQTPEWTPSVSGTVSQSPSPEASPSATAAVSATPSPPEATETPSVAGTETPSVMGTETPSVTGTETPSVTGTETPSATGTGTPSVAGTATPSVTGTETPSATETGTPSVTGTLTVTRGTQGPPSEEPSPMRTASTTDTLSMAGGPLTIVAAAPIPNPDPNVLAVEMAGPGDGVEMRVFTVALVLTAQEQKNIPLGIGWNEVPLGDLFRSLAPGPYYVQVRASSGAAISAAKIVKVYLVRD